jgi:Calcium-activated chloride channel
MIKEFLFLGDPDERNNILQLYQKEKKNILFSFLSKNTYRKYTKTIDTVYEHFGEKFAFYFAWLLHYTAWLIIPSIIGGIFWLIQMGNFLSTNNLDTSNYADATDSVWNCLYSMCIALWAVFFVESWK